MLIPFASSDCAVKAGGAGVQEASTSDKRSRKEEYSSAAQRD